jgi:hypothetical protein
MALSANTVWEVRTAGNDTNGGGFVTGAAGTDFSQQDAKNSGASNKSTTDAVAAGSTTITSATANFGTGITGNIVYFQGGTGAIAAVWRQATFVTATSITIDASIANSSGMTMNIGGALLTPGQANTNASVAGMNTYVKAGTYGLGATLTYATSGANGKPQAVIGYTSTRGDGGQATFQGTATNFAVVTLSGNFMRIENITLDCNNQGTSTGVNFSATNNAAVNCIVKNFTVAGFNGNNTPLLFNCRATAGGSAATAAFNSTNGQYYYCIADTNACPGFSLAGGSLAVGCISANNTGASSDGISATGNNNSIINCICYTNGRDGLRASAVCVSSIIGNIFYGNAGTQLNLTAALTQANPKNIDFNAFGGTGTARAGVVASTHDVSLTADPFTAGASLNFALTSAAGGGAALKGVGFPGTLNAGGTGFADIGAVQHQDSPSNIFILND